MSELITMFKEFTPGAWGIWTGVIGMFAWWLNQTRLDRKLSAEDRQARREGFEALISRLMVQNKDLSDGMAALRIEYDDHRKICQIETDQLRRMVIDLEGEVAALKRNRAVDDIHEIRRRV